MGASMMAANMNPDHRLRIEMEYKRVGALPDSQNRAEKLFGLRVELARIKAIPRDELSKAETLALNVLELVEDEP
jgi:hypothetical protein